MGAGMTKLTKIAMLAAASALSLSACSSETEEPTSDAPATGETSVAAAEPEAADADGIPAGMLGVWDYIEGTCDPASDLRLEIAPDHLLFYEAYGEIQAVTRDGDAVTLALAMEGEGETWEESLTYRLADNGEILESDTRAPVGDGPLLRKRCEG